ncbi:MAG TPA: hypothetical protein VKV15_14885 [Bryobacteraceae bacterium]|nr:hypothetical protein [Bryobacteraceae bacterium]
MPSGAELPDLGSFERLCRNDIPKIVDLPTGLGKTSVIDLWFLR